LDGRMRAGREASTLARHPQVLESTPPPGRWFRDDLEINIPPAPR